MRRTKYSFANSCIALLLCISMLLGTTFAWFSDKATTNVKKVQAGTLQVDLELLDKETKEWTSIKDSQTPVFDYDKWEPGYLDVKILKIENEGDLAFQWVAKFVSQEELSILAEVIDVYVCTEVTDYPQNRNLDGYSYVGSVSEFINTVNATTSGYLLSGESVTLGIALKMRESAGNSYQELKLGAFDIQVLATQYAYEYDSNGSDYDKEAEFDFSIQASKATATVNPVDGKVPDGGVTLTDGEVSAYVPAGVKLKDGVTELVLTITPLASTTGDVSLSNDEVAIPVDVHIEGIADDNDVPIIITLGTVLPKYLNMGNYRLYHVESGANNVMTLVSGKNELNAHNQFCYDADTGTVIVAMATFSEVTLVANTGNPWSGNYDNADTDFKGSGTSADPYLISSADELAGLSILISNNSGTWGSKHYKLICDINIDGSEDKNGKIWYPIGYRKVGDGTNNAGETWYTYGGAFSGVFDGGGHTITGIVQNTWLMDGNYGNGYYKEAMGLFGCVKDGTIQNLTIDKFFAEGEFTPMGCVAAFASGNAKFVNITLTNCYAATYNTSVGGVVGRDYGDNSSFTFQNITIDSSNTVYSLWNSWDGMVGGVLGYLGEYGSANFVNCVLAPTINVYNDVCGAYQYYRYRYSGMVIGTVDRKDSTNTAVLTDSRGTITAKNCVVDFGDRHEYYYCEFEKNGKASYSSDYKFSRISHDELVYDTNGNVTGCTHSHTAAEDKQAVYLPFRNLFGGYGWGVKSVDEYDNIDITTIEGSSVKFAVKDTISDETILRVGNQNSFPVGTLFTAVDGAVINTSGVYVSVTSTIEGVEMTGTFTLNSNDWTKSTLKINGTGIAKITIQDYNNCTPTTLYVEVVEAVNSYSGSVSGATKSDVVLLENVTFSTLTVSSGYTLYGNNFTMTAPNDVPYNGIGVGFITLTNGTLDNVSIVCPNFSYSILYYSDRTNSENTDGNGNQSNSANTRDAVYATGNCIIRNSYISGGRAAIDVASGKTVIENSVINGGATANLLVGSAESVTLKNVAMVQKPTQANVNNTSKILMGFSGLLYCDSNGNSADLILEGNFSQNAWVNENYSSYLPSSFSSAITTVMKQTDYLHDLDGDGTNESLNLGFVFYPADTGGTINPSITDNRTNKTGVPYDTANVSALGTSAKVYSYKNSNGTDKDFGSSDATKPDSQGSATPTVSYTESGEGLTFETSYDGSNGWTATLTVDLDTVNSYTFDFRNLLVQKYGTDLDYTISDSTGSTVDKTSSITLTGIINHTYTLTITDDMIFDANGNQTNETATYTYHFVLVTTKTSIPEPVKVADVSGNCLMVVKSKDSDWSAAFPALSGAQIQYWSVKQNKLVTLDLADLTPTTAGKQNGTNNYWLYQDEDGDFTLKITAGLINQTNSIYGMPVMAGDSLYFVISGTKGYVSTNTKSTGVTLTYEFTDANNGELSFTHKWSYTYSSDDTQYSYDSFVEGTLKEANSCVTPDTLITLADGTQKRVNELTGEEMLLVWNMETGKLDSAPIMFVDSEQEASYEIIHLYFSDGTNVKVISEHGFWDYDLNRYVYLDANATDYLGHTFAKQSGNTLKKVQLVDVVIESDMTTAWSPVTADHLCYFVNGMLSMPGGVGGLFNIFDVDAETMTYDFDAVQRDIETYGLFTYEELNAICQLSEDMFKSAGGAYLKISIGKGNLTMDELISMIQRYSVYFQ